MFPWIGRDINAFSSTTISWYGGLCAWSHFKVVDSLLSNVEIAMVFGSSSSDNQDGEWSRRTVREPCNKFCDILWEIDHLATIRELLSIHSIYRNDWMNWCYQSFFNGGQTGQLCWTNSGIRIVKITKSGRFLLTLRTRSLTFSPWMIKYTFLAIDAFYPVKICHVTIQDLFQGALCLFLELNVHYNTEGMP